MASSDKVARTFDSFRARQREVLKLLRIEFEQVETDLKDVVDHLADKVAEVFPSLEELPLHEFTIAAQAGKKPVDFERLRVSIEKRGVAAQQVLDEFILRHGGEAAILRAAQDAAAQMDDVILNIAKSVTGGSDEELVRKLRDRLSSIENNEEYYGLPRLSNANRSRYEESWGITRLLRSSIDGAAKALQHYVDRGGLDLDADRRLKRDLEKAQQGVRAANELTSHFGMLKGKLQKPSYVHAQLCVAFADLLSDDRVADALGQSLNPETTGKLMAETLKIRNLEALHESLKTLIIDTEVLLGMRKAAGKTTRKSAKEWSDADLVVLRAQMEDRAEGINTYVERSRTVRGTLHRFSSEPLPAPVDNSWQFLSMQNLLLLQAFGSSASDCPSPLTHDGGTSSLPSLGVEFNAHGLTPLQGLTGSDGGTITLSPSDTGHSGHSGGASHGSSHGSHGHGTYHGHSDNAGHHEGGSSGGWGGGGDGGGGGGGYSDGGGGGGGFGGGGGDGGGGGGFISAHIADDRMMQRHFSWDMR